MEERIGKERLRCRRGWRRAVEADRHVDEEEKSEADN